MWDGIEINGGDEKKEGAVPFACSGDGSPTVVIRIKNVTDNGIRIDKKNIIGQGKVIRDAVHATADPCTMELMRVKEKDPEEREVEEEGVEKVHVFNRSNWLQLYYQKVLILFGGPGGVERGLKQAQDAYGLAFTVVLVVERDIEMATISRKAFPGVPVVQHKLGVSHAKTLDVIRRYVPEDIWYLLYVHSSPSCVDGSAMNLLNKNMAEFVRLTRWTTTLMHMMSPGRWTLENVPRVKSYLMGKERIVVENFKLE